MYFPDEDAEEEEEEWVPSLLEFMPADVLLDIFKFLDWRDLCQLSCTCTKFRTIVQSTTLWSSLRCLDFEYCSCPDPEKILSVIQRCPNVEHVLLGNVLTEASPVRMDEDYDDLMYDERPQKVTEADKFVLDVLRACQHLTSLSVHMSEATDRTVEAVSAKCSTLQKFRLMDNNHIHRAAIRGLLSNTRSLTEIQIERCQGVAFPSIIHMDPQQSLSLTHVSLIDMEMVLENVTQLLRYCPHLVYLNLSGTELLQSLKVEIPQRQKNGLDTLQQLILAKCQELSEVELPYCPSLRSVDVSHCARMNSIQLNSPVLHTLEMEGCETMCTVKLATSDVKQLTCDHMTSLTGLQSGSKCLTSLSVKDCAKLRVEEILDGLGDRESLTDLNIYGCQIVNPDEVNTLLLTQLTGLKKLTYGGHSWINIHLRSPTLTDLELDSCPNVSCVPLNMGRLERLVLRNCRDITEQEMVDGLLYGKQIKKKQGLESLVDDIMKEEPFSGDSGTPNLHTFVCRNVPGIFGEYISNTMSHFRHLATVEFVQCSVVRCTVNGWPSLKHLKLESCSRLKKLFIRNIDTLVSVDVRWCGMVDSFTMLDVGVTSLDTVGTNFSHLHLICDRLQHLNLNGVCTQTQHTMKIRCQALLELSVTKCDRLSETVITDILQHSPRLRSLTLKASLSLRYLNIPSHIDQLSLTGHRVLREITVQSPVSIRHLTLNNLPKLLPEHRLVVLRQCEATLRILELRAIPGEKTLDLHLRNISSLTLDQGIHLNKLEINCPKLQYLRIQGCPNLHDLSLHIDNLSQMQVYHSAPLLALRSLHLHCTRLSYLATVLRYYCPRLQALTLYRSELRTSQIYRLAHNLCDLHTLTLHDCDIKDMDKTTTSLLIEATAVDRENGTSLTVEFATGNL